MMFFHCSENCFNVNFSKFMTANMQFCAFYYARVSKVFLSSLFVAVYALDDDFSLHRLS